MITIALITFRESVEILLVGSIILTSLKQLKINKTKDLYSGATVGLIFTFILFIIISFAESQIHFKINEEMAEIMEGINYLGSGIFLFLTSILLHNNMKNLTSTANSILLDTSLFALGFLLVFREGIEIIVFSALTTLTSSFVSSIFGFILGIASSLIIVVLGKYIATAKLSPTKIIIASEWGIKLISLYFVTRGVMGLSEFIFSF